MGNAISEENDGLIQVSADFPMAVGAQVRRVGLALAAAGWFAPASAYAQATDWPTRSVTVVVGYAAGGNTDVMARMASKTLSEELKQSFVVDNRVGAGGAIAATYAAQAAPDGYTLFFAASPQIAIVPQIQKVNYDPKKDFAPVSIFGTGPFILGISSSIPAKTLAEFVAYAKTRKINYGSSGAGSVAHLAAALFVARAGLDAVHVPFRGSGQVTAALLGGQIDMFFGNASEIIPQAESGKVRILGVAAPQRMKQLPNVPTISETYPGMSLTSWNGFLVPAKTPRDDHRETGKARHRGRQGSRQCRAIDEARHRAERHDPGRIRCSDQEGAAAVRCRDQGRQFEAGIAAAWQLRSRAQLPRQCFGLTPLIRLRSAPAARYERGPASIRFAHP